MKRYHRTEIPKLEAEIKAMIAAGKDDESPNVVELVQNITGPNAGLIYDPKSGKLDLAEGWIYDNDGYVVPLDDVTGPGTGMIYKDGKLVPAE